MPEPVWVTELRPCPACGALAEPEDDGEVRVWACTAEDCVGYEFGHERVRQDAGACSVGVPADVRSQFQAPPPPPGQVFIGTIGRRPE